MTHEDYCTYAIAKALKKLGFDWPCRHYYTIENATNGQQWFTEGNEADYNANPLTLTTSAPTLAVAAKWMREVKGWHVEVRINGTRFMYSVEIWETKTIGYYLRLTHTDGHVRLFDSYEDALTAGLTEALKLLNNKTDEL